MHGEVIAIGDELTSGERLDTNSQWLSQRLTEQGVEVRHHATVGDDLAANIAVFKTAISRADVIVTTGGLGPTADDLTREAIAEAIGVDLVRDEAIVEHIRRMFASRGRTMPEQNSRQADFPRGATAIPNPNGTAPGVAVTIEREGKPPCCLFALPGVPAEMHEMWAETVAPSILAASPEPRVIRHRKLKCFGTGESHIEAMLPDLIRRGREPRVGITASGATITLRVTAAGADEAAALAAIEPTLATIRKELGVLVFGEEDDEMQDAIARLLAEHGKSVATVESWTGGLLAGWLRDAGVVGESRVTAEDLLTEDQVAAAAASIRNDAGADFGLAIGAATGADVPSVAVALAAPDGGRAKTYPLIGHPSIHRPRIAKLALDRLRLHLLNKEPPA